MKPSSRIALRLAATAAAHRASPPPPGPLRQLTRCCRRSIHSTPPAPATVSPVHGQGPPPNPPQPAADNEKARLERRKKQAAELLQATSTSTATETARDAETSSPPLPTYTPLNSSSPVATTTESGGGGGDGGSTGKSSAADRASALARKRFWRDVHVRDVDGAWEVHLDARPLRHPATKRVVRIPASKPLLASALALEWDLLVSAQHATRQHLIPLTGLVCRAIDIVEDDEMRGGGGAGAGVGSGSGIGGKESVNQSIRANIVDMVMRYLDTDSLLCWAPPPRYGVDDPVDGKSPVSLRDMQRAAAEDVVGFLTSRVWPGVAIEPVLDGESIMPRQQPPGTRQVVEGWVSGLDAWELAGLERAVLAGKGLLGAVRLLVEWTEGCVGVGVGGGASSGEVEGKFGVEEAARLASIEVNWQIGRWGEVEDTHDVEKEDLRRQLGSVVLLVSGMGTR